MHWFDWAAVLSAVVCAGCLTMLLTTLWKDWTVTSTAPGLPKRNWRSTGTEYVPIEMYTYVERMAFPLTSGKRFWQRKAGDAQVAEAKARLALFILTMTIEPDSYAESYVQHAMLRLEKSKTTPISRKDLQSIYENLLQYELLNVSKLR